MMKGNQTLLPSYPAFPHPIASYNPRPSLCTELSTLFRFVLTSTKCFIVVSSLFKLSKSSHVHKNCCSGDHIPDPLLQAPGIPAFSANTLPSFGGMSQAVYYASTINPFWLSEGYGDHKGAHMKSLKWRRHTQSHR
jgi:hypothetical protein